MSSRRPRDDTLYTLLCSCFCESSSLTSNLLLVVVLVVVVVGIITTVKRKQEFRIRLQSRARRRVEKQLDDAEDERQRQTVTRPFIDRLHGNLDLARDLAIADGANRRAVQCPKPTV